MDGRSEYRADLIPSGQCVDGEESIVETFKLIDTGDSDLRKLALASAACQQCVQLEHCQAADNEAEGRPLTTELWRRGVGLIVTGGATTRIELADRPLSDTQPAFRFDLRKIPEDPKLALAALRQGSRAEQFRTNGPTPRGVKVVGASYLEHLANSDQELHSEVVELGDKELEKSFKYIVTTIFQQKDFEAFASGKGVQTSKNRYSPERFDLETDGAIVTQFLKDALAIKMLGLSQPAAKAMQFTPEFYEKLLKQYSGATLSAAQIDDIITSKPRTPVAAIEAFKARRDTVYEQSPTIARSTADRVARRTRPAHADTKKRTASPAVRPGSDPITTREELITRGPSLEVGIANRVAIALQAYGDDHPIVRLEDMHNLARRFGNTMEFIAGIQSFIRNVEKLTEKYGGDPAFSESTIRGFSRSNLDSAEEAAVAYAKRVATLRAKNAARAKTSNDEESTYQQTHQPSVEHRSTTTGSQSSSHKRIAAIETAADGDTLPISALHRAARNGTDSLSEARIEHTRRTVQNRFASRARKLNETPLSPLQIERIVTLYPRGEVDTVSETIYDLVNRGLLVKGRADSIALGGQTHEDLDKIFSPKTSEYVTFSAVFEALAPIERLAFAHHHGLVPLLYGRPANTLQLELVGCSGMDLAAYYDTTVVPHIRTAQDQCDEEASQNALSFMLLNNDLSVFDTVLSAAPEKALPRNDERLVIRGMRDTTLVVGGKALYLHEKGHAWDWTETTPDFASWLEQKIASTYPPHQQERAFEYVHDAISGGVLELLGGTPGEFRLGFSPGFYDKTTTDLERASIAHAMGIDRLLYGSDLSAALRHRLGDAHRAVRIYRADSPEVIEYPEEDLATELAQAKIETLDIENQEPLAQLILTRYGADYVLDALTDDQWKMLGAVFAEAFNRHARRAVINNSADAAAVALAWAEILDRDTQHVAYSFGLTTNDIDQNVTRGLAYIRAQIPCIASHYFTTADTIMATVIAAPAAQPVVDRLEAVAPAPDFQEDEEIVEAAPIVKTPAEPQPLAVIAVRETVIETVAPAAIPSESESSQASEPAPQPPVQATPEKPAPKATTRSAEEKKLLAIGQVLRELSVEGRKRAVPSTANGRQARQTHNQRMAVMALYTGVPLHPDIIHPYFVQDHRIEEGRKYTIEEIANITGLFPYTVEQHIVYVHDQINNRAQRVRQILARLEQAE